MEVVRHALLRAHGAKVPALVGRVKIAKPPLRIPLDRRRRAGSECKLSVHRGHRQSWLLLRHIRREGWCGCCRAKGHERRSWARVGVVARRVLSMGWNGMGWGGVKGMKILIKEVHPGNVSGCFLLDSIFLCHRSIK